GPGPSLAALARARRRQPRPRSPAAPPPARWVRGAVAAFPDRDGAALARARGRERESGHPLRPARERLLRVPPRPGGPDSDATSDPPAAGRVRLLGTRGRARPRHLRGQRTHHAPAGAPGPGR